MEIVKPRKWHSFNLLAKQYKLHEKKKKESSYKNAEEKMTDKCNKIIC